jgi:L-fucose isomerase-like protein
MPEIKKITEDIDIVEFGQAVELGEPDLIIMFMTGGGTGDALRALGKAKIPVLFLAPPYFNSLAATLNVWGKVRRRATAIIAQSLRGLHEAASAFQLAAHIRGSRWLIIGREHELSPRIERLVELNWMLLERFAKRLPAEADIAELKSLEVKEPSEADLKRAAALEVAIRDLVKEKGFDLITGDCFGMEKEFGCPPCWAYARLLSEGITAVCEGHLACALSMLIVQRITGSPPWMANIIGYSDSELKLAHCTAAISLGKCALRSHYETGKGVSVSCEMQPGPVTLLRVMPKLKFAFLTEGELQPANLGEDNCRTQAKVAVRGRRWIERAAVNHVIVGRGYFAAKAALVLRALGIKPIII